MLGVSILTEDGSAQNGHPHHWVVDAVLGASMALVAITSAQAALPAGPLHVAPRAPAFIRAVAAVAPTQVAAPVLIAFSNPIPGASIDSPFGLRQLPWEGQGRLHAGVDILAQAGAPILAAADGVVAKVSEDPGYGRFVDVAHAEGLTTRYAHMGRFEPQLKAGTAVKAGQPIGFVGSTGSSTGAHLHFEIRDRDDRPMNPELFLGRSFATAEALPLKEALHTPSGVRVAYVSNIPLSKRAQMDAKTQPQLDPIVQRRRDTEIARRIAASMGESGADASAIVMDRAGVRPHATFRVNSVPDDSAASRPLPAG